MNVVILAGGGGTRLWPLSRHAHPKQFQRLIGDRTLLELTRDRLGDAFPADAIYYSVTRETEPLVRKLYPDVPARQFLVEPEKRDTGPAMGYVAALLERAAPDEPVVFVPSDHYIRDVASFRKSLRLGEKLIRERGVLMDIGVLPTWPNEHLGYTHIGQQVMEDDGIAVFSFRGHTEKPDRATAQRLISSGEYLWHANYYMWTPRKFLEAYAQYAPETHAILRRIQQLVAAGNEAAVAAAYGELETVSIDYAITEKLDPSQVLIIRSPFDWNDVGMWSQLKSLQASERKANVVSGAMHVGVDTSDTLVMGDPQKLIATVGVENLIIVDTGDVLLVCRKDRDQDVKRLLALLKEKGYERYL